MSLQSIINTASQINVSRSKMIGIQYTRNQMIRTNQTPGVNPWIFTVTPTPLVYEYSRRILEDLNRLDRNIPETITFGDIPCMEWLFRYQGSLSEFHRDTITVKSFIGNQLILNVGSVPALQTIIAKGDMIQIQGLPYPFTAMYDVQRSTGETTATVTTHRPNMTQSATGSKKLNFGPDCEIRVLCTNMPSYRLVPGGFRSFGGITINNAIVEFDDVFTLHEYVI